MEWKDATTYSRDRRNQKQTAWALQLASLRISITSGHIYSPGVFVMHCHQLGFDTYDLKLPAEKSEEAKLKALKLCRERVAEYALQLNDALLQKE